MRCAFILIAAALMLSACCGRNCPAEVAVIPQPQVVETGRTDVVLRAGEYDVVRSLDTTMRASSYTLDIDNEGIRVSAGDAAGLFYAEQTLRQLVPGPEYNNRHTVSRRTECSRRIPRWDPCR